MKESFCIHWETKTESGRIAFCEYIDRLSKDGAISEDLAREITL